MEKVARFFAPIYRVTVSNSLGRGDKLDDSIRLTNDTDLIRSMMSDHLVQRIGTLERDAMCGAGLVAYGEFSGEECPTSRAETEGLIAVQLCKLHFFAQTLWFVKDNAALMENGFLDSPEIVSSRNWGMNCFAADGTDSTTTFNREELRDARELFRKLYSVTANWGINDLNEAALTEVVQPDAPPLSRAIYFLGAARTSNHLSVRIANYCSALEALLITSPTELTYRLCQRVAWVLGESPDERHQLFQSLKDAYEFRSKAVHGSYVSAKKLANDLRPAVRVCDDVLRQVLGKVVADDACRDYIVGETRNCDAFEDRLLRITLGANQNNGEKQS